MTWTLESRTVYLLMGPNGGEIVVCGIYGDREEAESKAARYNEAERIEGFPAGGKLYSVEAWRVN